LAKRPSPRQAARVKRLREDLEGYLTRLRSYHKKPWHTLSAEERANLGLWRGEAAKIVLQLARRGVEHPDSKNWVATLRAQGAKDFLRRAHLDRGVRRPITRSELNLWAEIDSLREAGKSREDIRKDLIARGRWKGSRQAFAKLLTRLDQP
jgi:hypothetical protein